MNVGLSSREQSFDGATAFDEIGQEQPFTQLTPSDMLSVGFADGGLKDEL